MIPGFVDSHAHLVFAGDRAEEFAARMAGTPYDAGGIAHDRRGHPGRDRRGARGHLARLLGEMRRQGTTTVEVKSGYGLTVADEARALAIARQFTPETTFLGAHVVPAEYADDPAGYVDLVTGPMLDACAPHANWIDVFCERGAFDADQARAVLAAGAAAVCPAGCTPTSSARPGVQLAFELGAASVDHCTYLTDDDVAALAGVGHGRDPAARRRSSPPGRRTPTPGGSSTPASRSRWPPTATRAPATRRRCRCASRSRSARWG